MANAIDLNVHHVTRIEGHGNIRLKASDGTIEKVEWQVPEAPRFFEAMVRGKHFEDIQTIVSRICGICSISHSLTAVKAVENALGVEVSEQTDKIRSLLHYSEQLQSHTLHVGYLVAPDLLGQKSVVPLVASHPDVVKTIIRCHRVANKWSELLAGRITHPVTLKIGGFSQLPTEKQLLELKQILLDAIPDLQAVANVVLSLADKLPDFNRPTEYIAQSKPGTYPFYHGDIGSTDADEDVPVEQFESVVNEYVSPLSTAKWTKWHRESFAVGALARFNLNADWLQPMAKQTAEMFGLEKGCCNPFMNNVAQVVECVEVVEGALKHIEELLATGIKPEKPDVKPQAGQGAGCTEAPRGILFHRYAFDDKGICTSANICIPTNQNHGNIQKDFEAFAPQIIDRDQDEIRLLLEMLVRSYDPCVSCSTHYLDVDFSDTRAPVLLAGLGSPLMSDEGVGVYLAEEIARRELLPPAIEVIELGTGNMNVLHAIADRRKVVFIDCARMDAEPGTMRRFGMDEVVSRKVMPNWSAHEGDLLNLLEISRTIGELPDEVVLFGIEPVSIEYGQELTPPIRARVEDYIAEIVAYMRGS